MSLSGEALRHYTRGLMTRPRSSIVAQESTRWYHCVSRCVRRAYLCGVDHSNGHNFDHRRAWLTDRLHQLAQAFAVDVAAYAVMSNHYHLVLHLAPDRARGWADDEVLNRWRSLFKEPQPAKRSRTPANDALENDESKSVNSFSAIARERLCSLSWFIRLLNESISRRANEEDDCRGRFWEGRFKSQALLDLSALISAMVYVDLNPIRAGMAESLQTSAYTSIQSRLSGTGSSLLMPFNDDVTGYTVSKIPFRLSDYIELAEWRGRQQRPGKTGIISDASPSVLDQLDVDPEGFLIMSGQLLKTFGSAIGSHDAMADHCARNDLKYLRGAKVLKQVSE